MALIGFIGMGNMGQALAKGLLDAFDKKEIIFSSKTDEKKEQIRSELGLRAAGSNLELVNEAKFIVLAVKPQVFKEVFDEIRPAVTQDKIFISLAPGKSIDYISSQLGWTKRIVRAMPNTPALIGCGMSGIAYDERLFTIDEIMVIQHIFSSVGKFEKVSEDQINAVVCASGSSPAYVYMFIDSLVSSVVAKGLSEDVAKSMVTEAVIGAAKMVQTTGEAPSVLRNKVCSKGGTTIAGVMALEAGGFTTTIENATQACYARGVELASE